NQCQCDDQREDPSATKWKTGGERGFRFREQALRRYSQLKSKIVGRLEAFERILLQTVPDSLVNRRVYGRRHAGKLRRVLMKDANVVSGGQAMRRLNGVIERLASGHCPLAQNFAQVLSFQQLGDDVRRAICRAHVMY